MNYLQMQDVLEKLMVENYKEFFKALLSIECGMVDGLNENILDEVWEKYYESDEELLNIRLIEMTMVKIA